MGPELVDAAILISKMAAPMSLPPFSKQREQTKKIKGGVYVSECTLRDHAFCFRLALWLWAMWGERESLGMKKTEIKKKNKNIAPFEMSITTNPKWWLIR